MPFSLAQHIGSLVGAAGCAQEAPLHGFCPHCAQPIDVTLPVEPLYARETTAQLIPTTLTALDGWVMRHKARLDPPQYRWWYGQRRRLFTANDIKVMRAALVSHERWPDTARKRRKRAQEAQAAHLAEGNDASSP